MKMQLNIGKYLLCLAFLAITPAFTRAKNNTNNNPQGRAATDPWRVGEHLFKYRVVNWCVTGEQEEEFWSWPLVQFRPYLKKTQRFQKYDPDFEQREFSDPNPYPADSSEYEQYEEKKANYSAPKPAPEVTLLFNSIQCDPDMVDLLEWENTSTVEPFVQVLKTIGQDIQIPQVGRHDPNNIRGQPPKKVNDFELSQRVHLKLSIEYEGGVEGIIIQGNHAPFGLGFPFGQFYDKEDSEDYSPCSDCDHSTFMVVPCLSRPDMQTLAPTIAVFHHQLSFIGNVESGKEYPKAFIEAGKRKEVHFNYKWTSHPCASSNVVEFFVLIVYDFQRRKYEVRRFGPYDLSPLSMLAGMGKNVLDHPNTCGDPASDFVFHYYRTLSHSIQSDCQVPQKLPLYILQPLFLPSPLLPQCRRPKVEPAPAYCDTICIPPKYSLKCHVKPPTAPDAPDLAYVHNVSLDAPRIRINGIFDTQCISNYSATKLLPNKQCPSWSSIVICPKAWNNDVFEIAKRNFDLQHPKGLGGPVKRTNSSDDGPLDPFFEETLCYSCDYPPTTTDYTPTDELIPFFKRNAHSALMVICFDFVLPISYLIARHYKETLHTFECKGWRLWLWLHVGICIAGVLLGYAGYSIPTFFELDTHMKIGYFGLLLCGSGLLTGWLRHKNPWINIMVQMLHSVPCYVGLFCGSVAFYYVEDISVYAHLMSIIWPIVLLSVMIVMHIPMFFCDMKIGMHPKRKLIPILQVRFETQLAPLHWFRIIFLLVFTVFSAVWTFLLMIV